MRVFFLLFCFSVLSVQSRAQTPVSSQQYSLQTTFNPVQYKNYYLLTLFQKNPEVKKLVQNDPVLNDLLKNKKIKISAAIDKCGNDINCFTSALKFNPDEVNAISERLRDLFKPGNSLDLLVRNHLIPSGCYNRVVGVEAKESLIKAWQQDAKAINYAIDVYVEGRKPNYPAIDSIGFDVKGKTYPELVKTNALLSLSLQNNLFFEPSMQFALIALEINERNNAADYEPMISTVNKMALSSVKRINFNNYKYSLILVPGEGPEEHDTELSAGGMLRCRLAVEQYHKGLAPFIMVSGGRVHPYKTKYSEACEMKKFLMQSLRVPESAILMEPHARHTTTNLRNAARIMFRYGMPMEKPALVVTVKSQSMYISEVMQQRCMKELGYEPYRIGRRLSDQELEFYPNTTSLQIDFDEPLDP